MTDKSSFAPHSIPLIKTTLVKERDVPFIKRIHVSQPSSVAKFLLPYFEGYDREEMVLLMLDTANKITGMSVVSTGLLSASLVDPRSVFRAAVVANAASIILAHNHPSGNLEPSAEDLNITRQIAEAGKILGIRLLDHLIIAEGNHISMAERGMI